MRLGKVEPRWAIFFSGNREPHLPLIEDGSGFLWLRFPIFAQGGYYAGSALGQFFDLIQVGIVQTEQDYRRAVGIEILERHEVAGYGDPGQSRQTIEEEFCSAGVSTEGGVFGIYFTAGEIRAEEGDEASGEEECQEYDKGAGRHAATVSGWARMDFMRRLRSRNDATASESTL